MNQPKPKLNRSSLDELIEYSALLVELYYILASEAVSHAALQENTEPNTICSLNGAWLA